MEITSEKLEIITYKFGNRYIWGQTCIHLRTNMLLTNSFLVKFRLETGRNRVDKQENETDLQRKLVKNNKPSCPQSSQGKDTCVKCHQTLPSICLFTFSFHREFIHCLPRPLVGTVEMPLQGSFSCSQLTVGKWMLEHLVWK